MELSRETIYNALFDFLQSNDSLMSQVKTFTRKLTIFTEIAAEDQPAIYLEMTGESRMIVRGQPPRITLESNLWVNVVKDGEVAAQILNPILDAIETALLPTTDTTQTLSNKVHHCWIEGTTQIFEGNLGDEALAIIPIRILVT